MQFSEIKAILSNEAKRLGIQEYDIYFSSAESLSAETLGDKISTFSSSNVTADELELGVLSFNFGDSV